MDGWTDGERTDTSSTVDDGGCSSHRPTPTTHTQVCMYSNIICTATSSVHHNSVLLASQFDPVMSSSSSCRARRDESQYRYVSRFVTRSIKSHNPCIAPVQRLLPLLLLGQWPVTLPPPLSSLRHCGCWDCRGH
eukprot:scpid61601/ scgid6764/ 